MRFMTVTNDENGERYVVVFNKEIATDSQVLRTFNFLNWLDEYSVRFSDKAPNRRNVVYWYTEKEFMNYGV